MRNATEKENRALIRCSVETFSILLAFKAGKLEIKNFQFDFESFASQWNVNRKKTLPRPSLEAVYQSSKNSSKLSFNLNFAAMNFCFPKLLSVYMIIFVEQSAFLLL